MTSNPLSDFTIQIHQVKRLGESHVSRFLEINDTHSDRSIDETKSLIDGIANYLISIDERISDFNIIYKDINNNWSYVLLEQGNFKSFESIPDSEHDNITTIIEKAIEKLKLLS